MLSARFHNGARIQAACLSFPRSVASDRTVGQSMPKGDKRDRRPLRGALHGLGSSYPSLPLLAYTAFAGRLACSLCSGSLLKEPYKKKVRPCALADAEATGIRREERRRLEQGTLCLARVSQWQSEAHARANVLAFSILLNLPPLSIRRIAHSQWNSMRPCDGQAMAHAICNECKLLVRHHPDV